METINLQKPEGSKSSFMPSSRIIGYDLARMMALIGMVIISFWELSGEGTDSPEWLNYFVEIIMGRAAVAFVMLAGVGLFLLTKAAYVSHDPKILAENRKNLMKRALFLFIVGMLNTLIWPWDILHFYAVYFMIAVFIITVPNRYFVALISVAIVVFAAFMFIIHYERGSHWDSIRPTDLWYLPGIAYHILFAGLYPVFPWIGFLFIGIWIGRQDLTNRHFRNKMLMISIVVVLVTEVYSIIYYQLFSSEWRLHRIVKLSPWFNIDPWEPMPLFFLSGAGSAIIVICLCMILAEKVKNTKWVMPFVAAGQSTLTLYVAHTLIGNILIWVMDRLGMEYPLFAVWGTLLYFMVATIFCYQWNMHYKRGPLELLMRHFLASPIRLTVSGVHPIDFDKKQV